MKIEKNGWIVVYERAIRRNGSLFFPERLDAKFLEQAHRTMGSFVYVNQYQNEIIPDEDRHFKEGWIRHFDSLPERYYTFAFIDPSMGESVTSDYTALVIVSVDDNHQWYLRLAQRFKINPTQIVDLCFSLQTKFNCNVIGLETVAYQKALMYMLNDEMRRRGVILPVHGVHPGTDKTKEMRIFGLVPRFEWGRILIARGQEDFLLEYRQFPRGGHDDILDALSQIETIAYAPSKERTGHERPAPNHPDYESWYRDFLVRKSNQEDRNSDYETGIPEESGGYE